MTAHADWDARFLSLAREVSTWSRDPSTQVGAVIVDPLKRIVATGFNGLSRNMPDLPNYYSDREEKLDRILHAEMNALLFAKQSVECHTLYTFPFMPCSRCLVHMAQAGIERIVAPVASQAHNEHWGESFERTRRYSSECGIELVEVEL